MPRQRGGKSTTPRTDAKRALLGDGQGKRSHFAAQPSDSPVASKPLSPETATERAAPGLHVVATPIGNLGDIGLRALEILRGAELIACEDTRVSAKLMLRYGIKAPLVSYHEHNAEAMRPRLLAQLERGAAIALISDAGTPLVSDPGFKLVRAVIDAGYPLHAVPGASASLTALVLSGLPPDRFFFAGFLEPRTAARRAALAGMAAIPGTLIFYESGSRLAATLADMAAELGDRAAAVARELTKLYEEVRRGTLAQLAAHYAASGAPKGEIVVLVGPPAPVAVTDLELDAALREALSQEPLSAAVARVAGALSIGRGRVYRRALELSDAHAR